jgi:mRNA-degrading endonuclease RelE of RelBE toxin-antitoxin system
MATEKKVAAPTVRLKTSLRKKLKKLPRQERRSVANYLEQLIKREIERQEVDRKGRI